MVCLICFSMPPNSANWPSSRWNRKGAGFPKFCMETSLPPSWSCRWYTSSSSSSPSLSTSGGEMAVDGLERVEEQQVTPMEGNVFSAHVDAGCPLMDEMELMAADAVGDGTQIALAALTRRIVGYAASENAANVIPLCQLWQAEVAAFCHIILGFYII